ncbi:MAG TPA: Ig-like domain-containing protein, partial [Bacteroidales bacterium]|nr:Ig-like domain-containing protein [Bacteroidales bacterium]
MKKSLTVLLILFCIGSVGMNTSAQDKDVLFLVDDATVLNLSDSVIRIVMENAGYDVTTMTGDVSVVGDTAGVEIVVISSTLKSSTVRDKFKWIELPILVWENGAYDDFGMTNTDKGTEMDDNYSIYIKDNSHPVANGLPTGDVKITSTGRFTTGTPYVAADPAYAAEYFAALSEDHMVGTWFMYEVGDSLDPGTSDEDGFPADGLAMGMRFGFPFEDNTFETATPEAGTILLNSLDYALDGAIESTIPVTYAYTLEDTVNITEGERVELTTHVLPGNATEDADIQYTSLDESVAFVDTTGVLRGTGDGTVKIALDVNSGAFKDTVVVNVTADDTPAILFISDLNESDAMAAQLMRNTGYIVNEVEDNDCVIEDTIAQDVIVISSSVSSKYVRSTYHTSPLPILIWEEAAYDEFFMAKSTGNVDSDPQAIDVVADTHPLATGLGAGSVTLGEPYAINYGNPYMAQSKSAIVIATVESDKGAWFIYEKGDSAHVDLTGEDDFPADGFMYGMRIGLPFRNSSFETAYPEAATVLLNSVDYALDGAIEATIPVAEVKLAVSGNLTLPEEADSTIAASVFPSNATNGAVTYTSRDESVVTYIDGTVTAVAPGNAYILAEADGMADSILVSVDPKNVTSITLAGAEIEAENFTFKNEVDDTYSWEIVGDTLIAGMSNGLAIQASPGDSVE